MANSDDQPTPPKRRRGPGKPFPKGVSGNPNGQPKNIRELRLLARAHSTTAMDRLAEIARSGDERAAVGAANSLLDRGWGKPTQPISGPDEGPMQLEARITIDDKRSVKELGEEAKRLAELTADIPDEVFT